MELFVFRHAEWANLYNCSAPDLRVDLVPLEQRRKFQAEAWLTAVLCLLYYILYIPCLASIWRNCWCHGDNACYKLMFYIGVMDVAILWLLGFLHPWLSLEGAVFCSHPTCIYWAGLGVISLWRAESAIDLTLAFNRCLELLSPKMAGKLFAGCRTYLWLSMSSLYALYGFLYEKPLLFSGLHFAWFFDPFIGYRNDNQNQSRREHATSMIMAVHNTVVAITLPLIYLIFAVILCLQSKTITTNSNISRLKNMTFLQVFIISLFNCVGCTIYVIMQHVEPQQWLITLAEFAWFHTHGFPPVIYLCLNKTIRDDCRMFCLKILRQNRGNRIHVISLITTGERRVQTNPAVIPIVQ